MKRRIFGLVLAACMLAVPTVASADVSYDFSDVMQPFLKLPFEVVSVEVTGEGTSMQHVYHLAESYDVMTKKLLDMYQKKQTIDKYFILGVTPQSTQEMYQVTIGYQNEHHYVQVTPDGSGCKFSVEAMPTSYVSGVYDVAIYGFRMPDGSVASAELQTKE
ncbi:MAG: hypothetical protein J6S69_07570 [Proteobacteria bacterium]|nr:hypothetical protein [Pseudomonadota bacterium]